MRGGVDTTQVMTETVEDKVSHSITGLDILKGIVAAGTVISGTVATQTKVFTNESAVLEKTVEKTDALATNDTVVLGTISTSNSASSTSLSASESASTCIRISKYIGFDKYLCIIYCGRFTNSCRYRSNC